MNKEKKEAILNWLKDKEESDSLSLEEREVFASIKELLHTKKYGLVFEEKEEDIIKLTNESILTLTQKDSIIVDKNKKLNYLIEGDNYQSLKLLLKTHRNRIDVIYIDPPYNTGNKDFIYNDQYVDSEDGFRHSKWLSFMRKRLEMAKELLSEKGVIFISIDDNEQAQLKLLCDEIFGELNLIANFIRTTRKGGGSMSKHVSSDHEYILSYCKNKNILDRLYSPYSPEYEKRYSEQDAIGKYFWDTFARNRQGSSNIYTIVAPDGSKINKAWIYKEDKFKDLLQKNEIRFLKLKNNTYTVQIKQRISDKGMILRSQIHDFVNSQGTKEINSLLGREAFTYAKPTELIKYLIQPFNKNAIILDFFAGSGTTGHAVAKLNTEDGGNRTYILCTNNENNICEDVTFKRLNNIQEELPHNLIYNKVDSINNEQFINSYYSREYIDRLNNSCNQLLQLELGKLIDNEEIIFATSQQEFNSLSQEQLLNAKAIFLAENNVDVYECSLYNEIKNKLVVIPNKYYSKELTEVGYLW
ncbi:site-specific DNA-methyltransferase [Mycoplasma sp. VS276A1]